MDALQSVVGSLRHCWSKVERFTNASKDKHEDPPIFKLRQCYLQKCLENTPGRVLLPFAQLFFPKQVLTFVSIFGYEIPSSEVNSAKILGRRLHTKHVHNENWFPSLLITSRSLKLFGLVGTVAGCICTFFQSVINIPSSLFHCSLSRKKCTSKDLLFTSTYYRLKTIAADQSRLETIASRYFLWKMQRKAALDYVWSFQRWQFLPNQ